MMPRKFVWYRDNEFKSYAFRGAEMVGAWQGGGADCRQGSEALQHLPGGRQAARPAHQSHISSHMVSRSLRKSLPHLHTMSILVMCKTIWVCIIQVLLEYHSSTSQVLAEYSSNTWGTKKSTWCQISHIFSHQFFLPLSSISWCRF